MFRANSRKVVAKRNTGNLKCVYYLQIEANNELNVCNSETKSHHFEFGLEIFKTDWAICSKYILYIYSSIQYQKLAIVTNENSVLILWYAHNLPINSLDASILCVNSPTNLPLSLQYKQFVCRRLLQQKKSKKSKRNENQPHSPHWTAHNSE